MRYLLALGLLTACASTNTDRNLRDIGVVANTRVTFAPLDRQQTEGYLETERYTYEQHTAAMKEDLAALERGRGERYREVQRYFPECDRQKHCLSQLSHGDIKRFERYNELAKEIHQYDEKIVDLRANIKDWGDRLEIRQRAILNRFLVHEILQIPAHSSQFQSIQVHSLENFGTRRQLSEALLRYTGLSPKVWGDYDFREFGHPVDEAAVVATYDVQLVPDPANPQAPRRFVAAFLVNTYQTDVRHYDLDFLHRWDAILAEPGQERLRQMIYCGLYTIASPSLAPQFDNRHKPCWQERDIMQGADSGHFQDRFLPERQLVPLSMYVVQPNGQPLP